ncbi:type VI secretion system tube protein TssD [Chloroflexota bacterium]
MKKLYALCSLSLIILLILALLLGCKQQPTSTPEPIPTMPSTPASESPPALPPAQPEPTPEPSTVLPPAQPEPTPEPAPEPEIVEPLIHSSAYVKFEGIDGESKRTGHSGWSEIVSFSQPIHKPGSSTDITRRRGDVVLEDIVVVKQIDKASPKLAEAICKGMVFPKVEIHLTGPSEGSTCQGTFYAYELKNVLITAYKVTGSNPLAYALISPAPDSILPYSGPFIVQAVDAPMEEISISFEEIKVTYTECDSAGKSKGNVEYSWKVEEGES